MLGGVCGSSTYGRQNNGVLATFIIAGVLTHFDASPQDGDESFHGCIVRGDGPIFYGSRPDFHRSGHSSARKLQSTSFDLVRSFDGHGKSENFHRNFLPVVRVLS